MKPTEALINGKRYPLGKLSDNPAKATGPKEFVETLKREVGYGDHPSLPLRS